VITGTECVSQRMTGSVRSEKTHSLHIQNPAVQNTVYVMITVVFKYTYHCHFSAKWDVAPS